MATVKVSTTISCSRAINYAEKRAEVKDAYNCEITNAKQEMAMVREMYAKTDGIQAHLIIQAFSPEESAQLGAEKINQLGMELAQAIAPDHQIAVYTHVDKQHYHNHIVMNSVNVKTGKKYHQHNMFEHTKKWNDTLVRTYGLEPVQEKALERRTMSEIKLQEKGKIVWKETIRQAIDQTMKNKQIRTVQDFCTTLRTFGVNCSIRGQQFTYELIQEKKKVRGNRLGNDYEKETIIHELEQRQRNYSHELRRARDCIRTVTEEVRAEQRALARKQQEARTAREANRRYEPTTPTRTPKYPSRNRGRSL